MDARIKKRKFLSIQVPPFGKYTTRLFREEKDDLERNCAPKELKEMKILLRHDKFVVHWWSKGIWGFINGSHGVVFNIGRLQLIVFK